MQETFQGGRSLQVNVSDLELVEPLLRHIHVRVDCATRRLSVYDTVRLLRGRLTHGHDKRTLSGLAPNLWMRFERAVINNQGQPTPVANLETLLEVIRDFPGTMSGVFRKQCAEYIRRLENAIPGEVGQETDVDKGDNANETEAKKENMNEGEVEVEVEKEKIEVMRVNECEPEKDERHNSKGGSESKDSNESNESNESSGSNVTTEEKAAEEHEGQDENLPMLAFPNVSADDLRLLLHPLMKNLRVHRDKHMVAVLDVIRLVTACGFGYAMQIYRRSLPEELRASCQVLEFNGRPTPFANARVISQIIWRIRGKPDVEFRKQCQRYVCRVIESASHPKHPPTAPATPAIPSPTLTPSSTLTKKRALEDRDVFEDQRQTLKQHIVTRFASETDMVIRQYMLELERLRTDFRFKFDEFSLASA